MEAYCQLDLAAELGYISEKDLQDVKPTFFSISRMLSALSNSFKKKLNQLSASGQPPK